MSLWANVPAAAPLPSGLVDAVVIGGGPAGYTAALYLARALAHPVVLAGAGTSQLADADRVENFPGFPDGIDGQELVQRMREQTEGAGADVRTLDALRLRLAVADEDGAPVHEVETAEGTLRTRSVVLATGSAPTRLGLDGEAELIGRGIAFCAVCEAPLFHGREVVVVGGGDSAFEEALALAAHAERVHLVHRRSAFRAAPVLVERVRQTANIEIETETIVTGVQTDAATGRLSSVTLSRAGAPSELAVDGLFIAIGHEPRVELVDGAVALAAGRHIHLDGPGGATKVPGVFAAGDVADASFRQAVTAAGSGCAAALEVQRYLQRTGEKEAVHTTGPLSGIRVVDLTRVVMGPFATQILADQGADVVMVEEVKGDTNRVMGPGPSPEFSGISLNLLRNKRSAALDLKDPADVEAVRRLIREADVVVATMLPVTLTRLGLDYEAVRAINPGVVYCQAQGWALGSGDENQPAYDDIIQSAVGVGDMMARVTGTPTLLPTIFADKVAGLAIAQAVTAALFHKARTGEGQHVEVPMVQALTAFVLAEHGAGAIPEPPTLQGDEPATGYPRVMTPERSPQRTADGWIKILPYQPKHFLQFFKDAGREDLLGDPRFSDIRSVIRHSTELSLLAREVIATKTTAEWLDYCRKAGIPAVPMATLQGMVDELPLTEHPTAGRYHVIPPTANFSATPTGMNRPAPRIGEHTEEVREGRAWAPADEKEAAR